MKKNFIIGIFGMLMLASCGKVTRNATIERDCTGTYIEINNKDYLVCNSTILSNYPDGSIQVKFKAISDCPAHADLIVCEMYHKNYGLVKILEVQ